MRPTQVGPGRNNYVPKKDAGKFAAAADTKGFRMTGTAVGPSASGTEYTATQDIGKLQAAADTKGFRMASTAVGPAASGTEYTATQDIGKLCNARILFIRFISFFLQSLGKAAPAAASGGGFRMTSTAVGPAASGTEYTATLGTCFVALCSRDLLTYVFLFLRRPGQAAPCWRQRLLNCLVHETLPPPLNFDIFNVRSLKTSVPFVLCACWCYEI